MATKVKLVADGVVTADQLTLTTASTGTNTTAPATTAFVQQEVAALVDSSPDALNTLNELAAALGDDANFSTTVTNSIATKLPLAGGALTGNLSIGDSSSRSFALYVENAGSAGAGQIMLVDSDNDTLQREIRTDAGVLSFDYWDSSNRSNHLTILANGNVGIGQSGPYYKFNVYGANITYGDARTNGLFFDTSSATTGTGGGIALGGYTNGTSGDVYHFGNIQGIKENSTAGNSDSAMLFSTKANGAAPTEKMRIDSSGNLGLGTNSPNSYSNQTTLTINGATYGRLDIESSNTLRASLFATAGSATLYTTTGVLSFDTSGGEAMRIDANGQVMISHTSSFAHSDADNLAIGDGTNNSGLTIYTGASKESSIIFGNAGTNGNIEAGIKYYHESHGTVANRRAMTFATGGSMAERMRIDSSGNLLVARTSDSGFGKLQVYGGADLAGGNVLLCRDTGNVGIGVSPSAKLEVQDANGVSLKFGDLASYPNNVVPCFIGTGTSALAGVNGDLVLVPRTSDEGKIIFATGNGGAATEKVRIANDGKVGIGTATTSGGKLTIYGEGSAASSTLNLLSTTSSQFNHAINAFNSSLTSGENNLFVIGRAGSTRNAAWMGYKYYSDASYSNCLTFGHWGNNNILNLNGYGVFMAGGLETAPNYPGAVTTARTGNASTTTQATWGFNATAGGNAIDFGFKTSGSGSFAVGVINYNETTWMSRLDYSGAIHLTNTTVQNISDRRLKKDIVDANSQWDDIKALQFKNFKWKDEARGTDTYLGLIADEVESVSPGLVGIDAISPETMPEDGVDPEYKNVKYSIVWMKAVKALQEAMEKIETLEAKVKSLEG